MSKNFISFLVKVRDFVCPIHRHEVSKFLPLALIIFLICFNYSTLKTLKDSMLITASGAEAIPFIKLWFMLPMALLFTWIYTFLSNKFSQENVFYILVTGFLAFFALFAYVLHPMRESLQPIESAAWLKSVFPNAKWLVALYKNWIFSAFYVISELWGSIVLNVLFWGFANEVTKVNESPRFYSVFSIGSNIAAILSGLFAGSFVAIEAEAFNALTFTQKEVMWEDALHVIMSVIIVCGFLMIAIFYWLNKKVFTTPAYADVHTAFVPRKKKQKLSLRESFKILSRSKYLLCIAIMVVAYNLVINLVEVVWKDQLRTLYPDKNQYMSYYSKVTIAMGIISTSTAVIMAKIIGRFGWTTTAMITPILIATTSAGFFTFMFFQDSASDYVLALTGYSPLAIAVFFGAAQNCISKAAKYSVFDATKEMAFVPLTHEERIKGKASIDGVGSRLGKSGGSLIHSGLLMLFSSLAVCAPYIAAVLMIVICLWVYAISVLGKKYNLLVGTKQEVASEAEVPQQLETVPST